MGWTGTRWTAVQVLALAAATGVPRFALAETGTQGFLGGNYHADRAFPEFMPLWREGWSWLDETGQRVRYAHEGMPLGGYLFAYVQNTTGRTLTIDDVWLDGVSLAEGVSPDHTPSGDGKFASHLQFSKLPAGQIARLEALGAPVWWKVDPLVLEPGQTAQAVVRLRRAPAPRPVTVSVAAGDMKIEGVVDLFRRQPRIETISFSPALDTVYLYLRHPREGFAPETILMDGREMADCAIAADPSLDVVPVTVRLGEPLAPADFHVFEARYADGSVAMASIRVWRPDFQYGMWGGENHRGDRDEVVADFLKGMHLHNVNLLVGHYRSWVRQFVQSEAGQTLCAELGIAIVDHTPKGYGNQRYNFLQDEPDAGDFRNKMIESPGERLGSMAQFLIARSQRWRREDPTTLQLLNIDNTYKPEQWYMYAQLPDIAMADPYYQEQLRSVYRLDPGNLSAYVKPTYVYAAGQIYGSAAAPKPMHLILHTCRFDMEDFPFRGPTPEEKRVEVYYALAAGAKGLSYWWYTPSDRYYGCGGDSPEMATLMTEIGLLGAEVRAADPILSRACPADLPVDAPRTLWVRTLLAGDDAVVVLVVNDNMACDRQGTRVVPIENAFLHVRPPAWLASEDCFEITARGLTDVPFKRQGDGVRIDLDTVEVTRMLVLTRDTSLRAELSGRYRERFAANAGKLLKTKANLLESKQP